jgi:hypothetical protein
MSDVLLGFEIGTGRAVRIPLAHTFVSGQTQLSGKTTTLRAIVERSGRRALAFVTKRGEEFDGRRIRPYLPRQGNEPIHWRTVEVILASAVEQKALKFERLWIINAAKGARSLEDVQANVRRMLGKAKDGRSKEIYTLLDEYLELVLPQMRSLNASPVLELGAGLNVMDLAGISAQAQAMVIRAALERINHHESDMLTVLPEAWEFAPRGRSAPAKDEAIAMARKGAAPKVRNFLLVDSQDIAGVDEVVRRACSVWLLGVQRELNELKRAIQMMPVGLKRPKAEDVATLEIGQFFACWRDQVVKVYVQPTWISEAQAIAVANGSTPAKYAALTEPNAASAADVRARLGWHGHYVDDDTGRVHRFEGAEEDTVKESEAQALREENAELKRTVDQLRAQVDKLLDQARPMKIKVADLIDAAKEHAQTAPDTVPAVLTMADAPQRTKFRGDEPIADEAMYQAFKARLIEELPSDARVMEIIVSRPELRVRVKRHVIEIDGSSLRGRIGRLIAEGFFGQARTSAQLLDELLKRGADRPSNIELGLELKALCEMGFFTRDNKWYSLVAGMKVNIVEAA